MNISTRYTSIELVPKYNNHSLGYAPVTVNITMKSESFLAERLPSSAGMHSY